MYILTVVTLTLGCGHVSNGNSAIRDSLLAKKGSLTAKVYESKINVANSQSDTSKNEMDSLIKSYIDHSDNKLIRLALKTEFQRSGCSIKL